MSVKFAFQATLGFTQWKSEEVVASLKKLGYQGVEWGGAHFNTGESGAPARVVEQTRDAGLEVSRIFAHEDLVSLDDDLREARIVRTLEQIQAAGEVGVSNVGTMTGPAPWDKEAPRIPDDISEGAAWDQVLEAYGRFGQAANEAGVKISSEGVWGMVAHDFYSHKFLVDAVNSESVGVNFDPSHGILSGDMDVGWNIKQWGSQIIHCHLKDAVGISQRPGEFLFPLLGEGRVDWRAFFSALGQIGYQGFAAVEFESFGYLKNILGNDPEQAARISMEQIRALTEAGPEFPPSSHAK